VKLVTFKIGDETSFGIWNDDGVIDLRKRLSGRLASLRALIAANAVDEARSCAAAAGDYRHADISLEKPLLDWGKCFCVGVNYPERNAEYKDGAESPKYPSLFVRFPESLVGPNAALVRPKESTQLDYEGEIALVIGKRGRRIPPGRWTDHVFGYTIANEGTIRDWLRHGKFNVTQGKNWASSGSLGPWIVPIADAPQETFRIITRVNGDVRQDDFTSRIIFPFDQILSYISTFCTLDPGDLILTGTPSGAGARRDPPVFLKAGDLVEIEVPGIGMLRNTVVDE
jgi:2-keto-4-pentenoate hydratase/2-oxohepta-3-ene-1,7-dioic acid hydratase in catechol pathway